MAGTILTSSPHYFSAVEDYHAFLMKNWLALATLRSKQNLPKSHCLYEKTNFSEPFHLIDRGEDSADHPRHARIWEGHSRE